MNNTLMIQKPKTAELLTRLRLKLDDKTGTISTLKGERINQMFVDNELRKLVFYYTSKEVNYYKRLQKRGKNTVPEKEWFKTLNKIALALADDLDLAELEVKAGPKTKEELESLGYEKLTRYNYRKVL